MKTRLMIDSANKCKIGDDLAIEGKIDNKNGNLHLKKINLGLIRFQLYPNITYHPFLHIYNTIFYFISNKAAVTDKKIFLKKSL